MNRRIPTAHGEAGFTLVELLVVLLFIALMAAFAIPAFLSQRDKAKDADAKMLVRTAQTAIETYAGDHDGTYRDATADKLRSIERVLERVPDTELSVNSLGPSERYRISVRSASGNSFSISRMNDHKTSYHCTDHGTAGCPDDGNWAR